eukprot:11789807-Karenia_brevis.AAC.1
MICLYICPGPGPWKCLTRGCKGHVEHGGALQLVIALCNHIVGDDDDDADDDDHCDDDDDDD